MEAAGSLGTRCGCQPAPWELSQNQMPVGVGGASAGKWTPRIVPYVDSKRVCILPDFTPQPATKISTTQIPSKFFVTATPRCL